MGDAALHLGLFEQPVELIKGPLGNWAISRQLGNSVTGRFGNWAVKQLGTRSAFTPFAESPNRPIAQLPDCRNVTR
jgi:hypothetical protein